MLQVKSYLYNNFDTEIQFLYYYNAKMMIKNILDIDIDNVNQYEFEAAWRLIFSCNKYIEKFQDYEYVEFNPSLKNSIRKK